MEKNPNDINLQANVKDVLAGMLKDNNELTKKLLDLVSRLSEKENSTIKNTEVNVGKVEGDFININTINGDFVMGNKKS